MAPSPQKASWRRVDTTPAPSDDAGVGASSASGQQSSPLAGQGISSSLGDSLLPSMTLQASSPSSDAIPPSSSFPSPTSSAATSTLPLPYSGIETPSQSLSDAPSPANTQSIFFSFIMPKFTASSPDLSSFVVSSPLASLGSLSAATTDSFSVTGSLDDTVPSSSLGIQNAQTPTLADNIPSSSHFDTSVVADTRPPLKLTTVSSHELPGPTRAPSPSSGMSLPSSASIPALTSTSDGPLPTFTPSPVPTSTSPGTDAGPSLTSAPPSDQSPSASLRAGVEFIDVTDVSPVIPTSTGGQPQVVTATTIGGHAETSIHNGETTGTALISPAAAVPSDNGGAPTDRASDVASPITETGAPSSSVGNALIIPTSSDTPLGNGSVPTGSGETIITPTTPAISTTCITSVPPSITSDVGQIDFFDPHHPFPHNNGQTSSFTTTTEVVIFSRTQISGMPTSIPITETIQTVLPTVIPAHFSHSPNRSVPVAVIAGPILSVGVVIALVLGFLHLRWRRQQQRTQRRMHWPTFVGFSQLRETHRVSVLRSGGAPYLPPLQSTVGWNDLPAGAFAFGEPEHDPFAPTPTPPMLVRSLPDSSRSSVSPLSARTIRRVPVPDPFVDSPGHVSTFGVSPEEPNRLSQASSHDEQDSRALTSVSNVGWAV